MPPKNDHKKKTGASGVKQPSLESNSKNGAPPVLKMNKIAMSFTATANLNSASVGMGNQPTIWLSKNAMIRCALNYQDIVIVQTEKQEGRVFCSKRSVLVLS